MRGLWCTRCVRCATAAPKYIIASELARNPTGSVGTTRRSVQSCCRPSRRQCSYGMGGGGMTLRPWLVVGLQQPRRTGTPTQSPVPYLLHRGGRSNGSRCLSWNMLCMRSNLLLEMLAGVGGIWSCPAVFEVPSTSGDVGRGARTSVATSDSRSRAWEARIVRTDSTCRALPGRARGWKGCE
jgi:hypothetical protein